MTGRNVSSGTWLAAVFIGTFVLPRTALPDDGPRALALDLGLGANAAHTFVDVCSVDGGDLVDCAPGMTFGGLSIGMRLRPSPIYAVGLTGLVDFGGKGGSVRGDVVLEDRDQVLWGAAIEGRLYPVIDTEFWICGQAGVLGFSDSNTRFTASGDEIASESVTQAAFAFGPGAGIDFAVLNWLLLGLEMRIVIAYFEDEAHFLNQGDSTNRFGTSLWLTLGFGVTFRMSP